MRCYTVARRRACALIKQTRSTDYYRSTKDPRRDLRARMREIAGTRVRYGYRRIHVLLKREGWQLGRNQAYRIYVEEQLQLRSKLPKRRKMTVLREGRFKPQRAGEVWAMDFVADALSNGSKFRLLTVVDVFSREALAIEVGSRLRGENVVEVLNRLAARHGAPKFAFVDNGWAAPVSPDTLDGNMCSGENDGNEKEVHGRIQARGGQAGHAARCGGEHRCTRARG